MKKLLYYFVIIICFISTSCSDWLDVQPKTMILRENMFETEAGYKKALTGVYIKLKDRKIYGENLTMTTIEHLVSHWNVSVRSTEEALNEFNYDDAGVKTKISSIYGELYSIIANVNAILENIDVKKNIFNKGMYELIKGEALALRAYCHFDILRLFGPVPTNPESGVKLSYVKTVSKEHHPLYGYAEYTTLIHDDLNAAEKLLSTVDPILNNSVEDMNMVKKSDFDPEDDFWAYRTFRMNYYSVLGLKSRFFLWNQDKENAYKYAKMVIDAENEDGSKKFTLGKRLDLSYKDYTFSSEHLLSLNIKDLEDKILPLYKEGQLSMDAFMVQFFVYRFNMADIRYSDLWTNVVLNNGSEKFVNKKYYQNDKPDISKKQVVPLMRLSEMYLIAIESAPLQECNNLYSEFCISRNNNPYSFSADEDRSEEILKEYRKEFYAEGHMFYAYKRMAVEKILLAGKVDTYNDFVVPLPDTEMIVD